MDLPLLDKNRRQPLVDQLVLHFENAIEVGRLRPKERLPTIREVAARVGVTRGTVQEAYRRLQAAGFVDATVGRGTVVCGGGPGADLSTDEVLSAGARAAYQHLCRLPESPTLQGELVCDFAELAPDESLFPVAGFTASLERVLARRGQELLGYGQPSGDLELRRLLAAMTSDAEAGDAEAGDPAEVLVTNGAQQGIDLVLRTFTRSGDGVAVAIPTYHHLFGLLQAHDLRVVPLRTDDRGHLDLEDLARVLDQDDVRLLYLMPTFHNPTGLSLELEERRALMRVVCRTGVPVLEDEFELDLRFEGEHLPALRNLDSRGLTVTVRTFSKGLFPGVRLGWVHAGTQVLGPMAALKRYIDLETSPLLQAALVDFLQSGAVSRHMCRMREEVGKRHAAAQEALAACMPAGFTWTRPSGGFALWVEGPPGFDSERLVRLAATRGVLVAPGSLFHLSDLPVAGIRLSISQTDEKQVRDGIGILGQCATELMAQADSPSQKPLIL